ncbi:MAG: hypothetical protein JO092_03845 [Candidatus Eremiobacteraeota bacterium]|nr:hypothetical protein [Candidatus Eremiobacteraeota bacterium]
MVTRGDFLASTALVVASPTGASPSPASSPTPQSEASFPPLEFDVTAFDAALSTTATHRHLFAATKLAGGLVLGQMRGVLDAYEDIGMPAAGVHPVAVFYHGLSVLLGFDDVVWNEYFIPTRSKRTQHMNEYERDFNTVYDPKVRGNPCLHKTGKKDDSSIEALVADAGARFFVCNNAAKGFAQYYIAPRLKSDPLKVYATLAAHLVPNAMLVPAGIWAVHAVQERRYTYLQATL